VVALWAPWLDLLAGVEQGASLEDVVGWGLGGFGSQGLVPLGPKGLRESWDGWAQLGRASVTRSAL